MRVAIYARVSTDKQNYQNQLGELLKYCANKGYAVSQEFIYEEEEHGHFPESKRPKFLQLLDDAAKRKFDIVLFWALDRFTREGPGKTLYYMMNLERAGISVISYTESYLNTTNENPFREAIIAIMATLAKQERLKIVERTKAALARAKQEIKEKGYYITKAGKKVDHIGKELSYTPETLNQIRMLRGTIDERTGKPISIYRISKLLDLNPGKIDYAIKHLLPEENRGGL